ncbi:MAG TPA: pilus assembly protein N-terminal domain-containing protein [Desulfobacteraceae bacterium]|nr:pilus assembly protein N-terminal domain-containing protein [Desulfobacteraceae bacterium]HPJ68871.1 pilus assembly protein N-terminal domain-containing protein [Desulfobacteraceae bacterium]HPQ28992.1 pilus assembly protein N-terminal domain-containing protein [Desulfobacteraceae bacterium]
MKKLFIRFGFLLFITAITVFTGNIALLYAQLPEKLEMVAGESRVFTTGYDIEKIAIGDPDIIGGVKTSDREFLINAKNQGQSNIFIWGQGEKKAEIQITVRSREIDAIASEIREVISDVEGVSVRVVGNRVFVEGEVFTHNSLKRVEKVIEGLPNVVNLVELSPVMKDIVKAEIEKSLASQGMRNIQVQVTKNTFMLTGHVSSQDQSERAQRIAKAYTPDIVNAIEIRKPAPAKPASGSGGKDKAGPALPPRPVLIEMSLNIMEIERNSLRDFGIHWNPGGNLGASGTYSGASGQSPSLAGSLAGTLSNLLPKTRRINETGQGRSLMQQTLITRNGDSAQFFAGSEMPVPVTQPGGTMSVEFKKVGVTLNFRPTIDPYRNIISYISVESSSITGQGPGGAPIISSTNLNTVLSVASGNSIALGGLIGQKDMDAFSGSPPGGGSSLVQANKAEREGTDTREVVIFVTPRILSTDPADTKELHKKVEEDFKKKDLEALRQQVQ